MESRNENVRALIEAGIVSAIVVIMALIIIVIQIGFYSVVIMPIPITVIYVRRNFKFTVSTIFVSTILVALLFNPIQAFLVVLLQGSMGLVLGYCLKHKVSSKKSYVILGATMAIAGIIYTLFFAKLVLGTGINEFISVNLKNLKDLVNKNINVIPQGNEAAKQMILSKINNFQTIDLIKDYIGGMLVLGYILSYINYRITDIVLRRLKYNIDKLFKLSEIFIPSIVGVTLVTIYIIGYLLTITNIPFGQYVLQSSMIVILFMFIIDGMSLIAYYLKERYKISRGFSAIIIMLALIFGGYLVFFILGIVDLVVDFRKLDPNPIIKR